MVKKNIFPGGAIFYRVTYPVGIYDYFLDFARGKNNELIFVAGAYYGWMEKDAIQKIIAFEK
jgi:hypothetical protein